MTFCMLLTPKLAGYFATQICTQGSEDKEGGGEDPSLKPTFQFGSGMHVSSLIALSQSLACEVGPRSGQLHWTFSYAVFGPCTKLEKGLASLFLASLCSAW